MELQLKKIHVTDVRFVDNLEDQMIHEGVLFLCLDQIHQLVMSDYRIESCAIELAKPGELTRIVPVKDVIEPRAKEEGEAFPGVDGEFSNTGSGTTICLKGCAVVTTGGIVGFQEGIIDMSGPLTAYTPFSSLINIVLIITKKEGVDPHEHEEVIRLAGIKVAHYIGKVGRGVQPDKTEKIVWKSFGEKCSEYPNLPKVAYVYLCMAQGLLHDTYFYGKNAQALSPTLISPLEVIDGAIVSGNCVSPGSKNTTYHHQNNSSLQELLDRHGTEINFMGIILSPLSTVLNDKYRNASRVLNLAEMLGIKGALISQEGFGNPTTDLMLICKYLEEKGIDTVIISNEDAGTDGYSESLPDGNEMANAIISTGNSNATIELPAMERTLGDLKLIEKVTGGFVGSIQDDGRVIIEIHCIMGGHNLLGDTYLSAVTR